MRKKGAGRGGEKGNGFVSDFIRGVLKVPHTTLILVLSVVPGTEYLGLGLVNWARMGSHGR